MSEWWEKRIAEGRLFCFSDEQIEEMSKQLNKSLDDTVSYLIERNAVCVVVGPGGDRLYLITPSMQLRLADLLK